MQLNTPSDQRQRHNYQRLFIKFPSSLCLYFFFLTTVVGGGVWLLLLLYFVVVFFFVRLFFLFIWKVRKAYMSSLCFPFSISYSYSRQFHDLCVF